MNYSAQFTRARIDEQKKGMSYEQLQTACGLGANAIRQMGKNGLASFSLAKIADVLNCSVDYLLGRTDNPRSHNVSNTFLVGDVSENNGAIGVGNVVTNNTEQSDSGKALLLELYGKMSLNEQSQLLASVISQNLKAVNPEQSKASKTVKYRINTYNKSEEERKKIKEYLEGYGCVLCHNVKTYMEFLVEPDFDIEGMLAIKGFYCTPERISD